MKKFYKRCENPSRKLWRTFEILKKPQNHNPQRQKPQNQMKIMALMKKKLRDDNSRIKPWNNCTFLNAQINVKTFQNLFCVHFLVSEKSPTAATCLFRPESRNLSIIEDRHICRPRAKRERNSRHSRKNCFFYSFQASSICSQFQREICFSFFLYQAKPLSVNMQLSVFLQKPFLQ